MTGSCNLASLSLQQLESIQADLLACRIRRECRLLSEREKQKKGAELLAAVPASLRKAVVERLKARSSA